VASFKHDGDTTETDKGLQSTVTDNLARAVKDNDLIYLDPIPTPANLTPVAPASMVKPTLPPAVSGPLDALHDGTGGLGRPFFQTLVPYAVHQAISVYTDRVESLIRAEVASRVEELDAVAASSLQSLGLPGALQVRTASASFLHALKVRRPSKRRSACLPPSSARLPRSAPT
jgi:programmed cell death 6-interacting protein